jgi:hypothetical protein
VAVAMDPVRESATSDMMAKVRTKMIINGSAVRYGTPLAKPRPLFSIRCKRCRVFPVVKNWTVCQKRETKFPGTLLEYRWY